MGQAELKKDAGLRKGSFLKYGRDLGILNDKMKKPVQKQKLQIRSWGN